MDLDIYWRCAVLAWSPGFGDRDAYGIIMTLVHLLAASLAVTVAVRGPFDGPARRSERWLWGLGAAMLVALAINKQLDLQSMLVTAARCVADAQGWYDQRRTVQTRAILGLILVALLVLPVLIFLLRRSILGNLPFVLSMTGLVLFVLLRAISFHHLDETFGIKVLSFYLHRVIESAALGTVILTSALRLSRTG